MTGPYRDRFSKSDQELIYRRFGTTPLARWKVSERLDQVASFNAQFVTYPGVGHEESEAMQADVARFFEAALRSGPLPSPAN